MNKRIGILIALVCISFACEKSIEVELPPVEERIGVRGLFLTTESISMNISHSKHIFDTTRTFHMENVVVDFYENDVFIETFENERLDRGRLNIISPSGFIPVENNSYGIVITAEGFKTASATCKVPDPVPIVRIDTSTVIGEMPDWYFDYFYPKDNIPRPMLECRILFKDPPDISNYYSLHVERKYYGYTKQILYICNDPILEFFERAYTFYKTNTYIHHEYFSDMHINGERYELVVLLDKNEVKGTIYFKLLSLSEEYFFYLKSVLESYNILYDPFQEPSQGYSNIQNGVGVFAGASISADSLIIIQ